MAPAVEEVRSLRDRRRPQPGSAAGPAAQQHQDARDEEEQGSEGESVEDRQEGVLEDGEGREHKLMNPTTRKVHCRFHSEVVVKRRKLRTAPVLTPCWRCLEVRASACTDGLDGPTDD
jgi:hypothetical protein